MRLHVLLFSIVRRLGPVLGVTAMLISASAKADISSELHLQSDSFLSPAYDATPQSTFEFFGAHFKSDPVSPDSVVMDVRGAYAAGAPQLSYTDVRELALRFTPNDESTITVGRKLEPWNELDRRWNFGIIEPVFQWNPLEPQTQGLTGAFWDYQGKGYHLSFFGSGVYIPSQGPSYSLDDNGQFVNESPWFAHPPTTVRLFQEESQIDYQINTPDISKIVLHGSYGARLDLAGDNPWRARFSALYLPINQLALPYTSSISIPTDRADVNIDPMVVYHSVQAFDLAYTGTFTAAGLSLIQDLPGQVQNPPIGSTFPVYSNAILFSPWVDFIIAQGWKVTFERLDIHGGQVNSAGPDSTSSQLSVTLRYPYREANQVAVETDTRLPWGYRLAMKTAYLQSDLNQFQYFTWNGRLQINRRWNIRSELQLVKAEDLTAQNQNAIADNINNAQFMVGVGYVL